MKMVAEKLLDSLHSSRRLLLHTHVFLETQPTTTTTTTTSHQENSSSSSSFRGGFDANLIMILSVLLCALICSLCVNSLIRCVFKCSTLLNRQPNYYLTTIRPGFNTAAGLDKRALSSFPVVKYSKDLVKIQGLDTECVICLSDFKQTEKLRILPVCNHGFHVKCIDRWLKSNSSCPTCRQSLVDTCHKIIGCHSHHHQSSAGPETVTGEMIPITIAPLQREDLVRNFRG